MSRLSDRAYDLLAQELARITTQHPLRQVQRDIILRRLNRLKQQSGPPLIHSELEEQILDLFPDFNLAVIRQAIQACGSPQGRTPSSPTSHQGPALLRGLRVGLGISGIVGGVVALVWIANLPYPMIRWPVSRIAPIVLLPSFMQMDHHYRQVVSLVEQSDQLINKATGPADITLGKQKVAQAQQSLDRLPVWFLGYYPRAYCQMFSCQWRFTYDEFATARAEVGRMQAKVFQEEQALQQFNQAEEVVGEAKAWYAKEKQPAAIAQWQKGLDALNELPPPTLAGRLAQAKLLAYERDFAKVDATLAGQTSTNTALAAAKEYAVLAASSAQNPPHPVEVWQKAEGQWEAAIEQLKQVESKDPGYLEAQKLKAQYENNLGTVQIRLKQEEEATRTHRQAQSLYADLLAQQDRANQPYYLSKIQNLLTLLDDVKTGTTAYAEAQTMFKQVNTLFKQVQTLQTQPSTR